jgi:two-component system, LytTR family, response regulator
MIKVILIDDEPLARELVREYLRPYNDMEIVEECNDGFSGVKAIAQHQPDLIFLDIQMPKINGFEMLELIDQPPSVIFTTAFDEYAIKAFENNAVDYLLKPFSRERFEKAIQKWLENRHAKQAIDLAKEVLNTASKSPVQQGRIVVKVEGKVEIIPIGQVHYLEANGDYVKIATAEKNYLKNKTMSSFEETMDPANFIRVHRSYIVNLNYVTRIDSHDNENHLAVLKSGMQIPVSRSGYVKLKEALGM